LIFVSIALTVYRVNGCAREIVTKRADARADTLLQWPGRGIRTH